MMATIGSSSPPSSRVTPLLARTLAAPLKRRPRRDQWSEMTERRLFGIKHQTTDEV